LPASSEVIQPSGLTKNSIYVTTYNGNKTFINSKTETVSINDKVTTTVTDYVNGTTTITTPEGRVNQSAYDVNTRLLSSINIGTLTPATFTYDDKGRTTKESIGTRESTYTYDAKGNIATSTPKTN